MKGIQTTTAITGLPTLRLVTYDLKVTASGFKPLTQTNLMVAANTVANVDVSLQVGAMSERVEVEASVVNLQTEKSDVHTELSETGHVSPAQLHDASGNAFG